MLKNSAYKAACNVSGSLSTDRPVVKDVTNITDSGYLKQNGPSTKFKKSKSNGTVGEIYHANNLNNIKTSSGVKHWFPGIKYD